MVKYPYKLQVLTIAGESVYDPNTATWVTPENEFIDHAKCRDENSSSGSKETTVDGEVYKYNWIIYAPKSTQKIDKGATVRVIGLDGEVRASGDLIKFQQDRLHVRIWL